MEQRLHQIIDQYGHVLSAKKSVMQIALCCVLAKGHMLIEDLPGVGKTTLVKFLAKVLGLKLNRIQFVNDLLPTDIIGTSIYHKETNEFKFHKGPIFGELILADELNRAPPKTQSALLQAMEEAEISVDNTTYKLSPNFMVVATQNPIGQVGTFDLPESQLDRFCAKFKIGYLSKESTIELLQNVNLEEKLSNIDPLFTPEEFLELQKKVSTLHIEDSLLEYIYDLLNASRSANCSPLSNRCGIDLVKMSKAHAFLMDRDYVIPDDIQAVFPNVCGHRLMGANYSNVEKEKDLALTLLEKVPIRK